MKHLDLKAKTRTELTDRTWLPVGAGIAELANEWAGRTDIIAFVGEGATSGLAPALFKPAIAEMELNVELAFGFGVKPKDIGDIKELSTRYEFPVATGAVMHEAYHARFSRWNIEQAQQDLEADEFQALMWLEESRIEKLGVDVNPKARPFLRESAMKLVMGDLELDKLTDINVLTTAQLVALSNGRVIAGVLEADEVAELTAIIRTVFDEATFIRLLEIIDEFQNYTNHWHIEGAYPLAKEWAKIIRDLQDERGETPDENSTTTISIEMGGESGEGDEGEKSEALKNLIEKLSETGEEVSINNISELYDQQEADEWAEEIKASKAEQNEKQDSREAEQEVFSKTTGEVNCGGTHSRLNEKREPTGLEYSSAVIVARMLEKAKYRERDLTIVGSEVPQGKLNTRAVIHNEALRSQGLMATAKEWKRKVRKQTDEPTLNVGIMVDISGSMRPAMQPMATMAWVMSEAVRRVQGKCSMVYYGQDVFPTLKAGQHLDGVKVYSANDPTEKFDKAFKALDGSLNLLYGTGARLLVVVSDGVYTGEEHRKAVKWVKRCEQQGVGVLWLTFSDPHESHAERICKDTNAVVLSGRLDPTQVAVEIGKASAKALEMTNKAIA